MGRGLAAILAVSAAEGPELREVAVDLIAPNPNQPRKPFDEEALLDLPEEAIALIESGALTEGHGRALLLASDHSERRRLARAAAEAGWSVRVTEEKACETTAKEPSAAPRQARAGVHPDQLEAMS